MVMKEKKKINIKKRREEQYTPQYWTAFRQPNNLDDILVDDPSFPWIRQPGWRETWSKLWFKGDVKQIPIDLEESESKYTIYAEMAGVSKEDTEVQIAPNHLLIHGKIKPVNEKNSTRFLLRERRYTTMIRSIVFSHKVNPDKSEAFLRNGILTVTCPKKKMTITQAGKRIAIKTSDL